MMIIIIIIIILIYPQENPSVASRIYGATGILFSRYILYTYMKKCIIHTYIMDIMFSTKALSKIIYILDIY